jgi:type IV secretory pathway VirB2 component (pilin)
MTLRRLLTTRPFVSRLALLTAAIGTATALLLVALPAPSFAQAPWERAALNLETSFTGPLARSLALVAIVIGGLMFMFGEGGAKRQISGIIFGGGLALFAAQFLAWLF